jgi:hypothetical protein
MEEKDHRLGFFKAGQGLVAGPAVAGDRVTAAGVAHRFNAGDHVPHFTGTQLFFGHPDDLKNAHLLHLVGGIVGHEANAVPGADGPFLDAEMNHSAPEGVVVGVEDQGLQRRLSIAHGRRQLLDHGFHDVLDAQPFLGRYQNGRFGVQAEVLFDLILDPVDVRRRQVDLVDYRNDFQVVFQCQVEVGQGLGLDALAGVDQQQGPFTGGQGPGDLVGEVHVARRVDQIQIVGLAIFGFIWQTHGLAFDGNAALALDIHGVQNLVLEIPVRDDVAGLDQPVGQGRLAMIDVSDDAEVAYVFHIITGLTESGIICRLTPDFNMVIIFSFSKNFY